MADYLYHTYMYHKTGDVIGIVPVEEAAKVTDFETNYKNTAINTDELLINATTFEIDKNYTQFKGLIDGATITWGDVKFVKRDKVYDLYLVTDSPL
jgi:hypothetical protein